MMDERTYKKEIIRMWDTLRGDEDKGKGSCDGVYCGDCPLSTQDDFVNDTCTNNINAFKVIKIVEKWARENPPKKYKVSRIEYDILQEVYSIHGNFRMYQNELINNLREKGYFKGSYEDTEIEYYLKNCEVKEGV